ncbi:hypothetical protein ACHAXT_010667 [Thalassiosira profunda]
MTGGGAATLPMNPALAHALEQHGVVPSPSDGGAPSTRGSGRGAGSSARTKTSVHALAMHPSLPRAAYLAQESAAPPPAAGSPSNKKKSAASAIKQSTTILSQTLVVQQYDKGGSHSKGSGEILASLSMEKLPPKMNAFRRPRSRSTKSTNQPLTLASLGQLISLVFLDREALFWQTARRQYGSFSNLEAGGALVDENGKGVVIQPDTDLNGVEGVMGRGVCLGLQFRSILVVLQFDTTASDGFAILCCLEGQRQNVGKEMKVQYTPTSAVVPVTNSVLVYGCSDGAMRFHNLAPSMLYSSNADAEGGASKSSKQIRQATIKSVRGPNGRNDPVVKIVCLDPAYHENHSRDTPLGVPTQVGGDASAESNAATLLLCSRLLTVCSSGVAFLWDVRIAVDRASGALRDMNVLPPLVRLDGLGSLTLSPRKPPTSNPQARAAGFWGKAVTAKSKDGGTEAPYSSRMAPPISYDPHRHLLFWALPSEAPVSSIDHQGDYELESLVPGSMLATKETEDKEYLRDWAQQNGGFVKVWDMSLADGLVRSSAAASSTPRPPPKIPPVTIAKLPTSVSSAESPLSMALGLCHTPISASPLACTTISRDGTKLLVMAAPSHDTYDLYDGEEGGYSASESPLKNKRKQISALEVMPKVLFVEYSAQHRVALAGGSMSPFVRGYAVSASHFTPDSVAVATDRGVKVASLALGGEWASKLQPLGNPGSKAVGDLVFGEEEADTEAASSSPPVAPVHAIMSTGGVSNRPGVVFVENNAVYASRLGTTRSSNLVEKVDLPEPTMLCKLHAKEAPWTTTRSTRTSHFAESSQSTKCPPRLISSPSGRYLCLYWEGTKSYEIVHASSLLAREQAAAGPANASDGAGQHLTPSVDSGNQVLSFAWIGDDDNFAILRKPADLISASPDEGREFADMQLPAAKGKQGKPQVELYKLAEVTIDAVELAAGATVAAATTVSLGSLAVRGGDRVTPTVLFGGPSLCVGCCAMSEREESGEGIAYFYSRKSGALETNDVRAAAYGTIGTSIPYPDQVAWDEDGRLCAVSYGSRVAIYLSDETQFILLGAVAVGRSDNDLSLVSLKFIHGALYCSTPTSVHAIFLGNLEKEDSVCELDAFAIATDGVPLYGTDNPDISSPTPVVSALTQPHVLAYHSGGLLVSTACGLRLLPLSHPIIRIGTLLAANLTERARRWIFAVPKSEHDNLARFLIRRGHADMAIRDLSGLSLELYIDLCMLNLRTDELEHMINTHGLDLVLEIADWGRGMNETYSAFLAIGLHMIGQGRVEIAKKLIGWATESGVNELQVDAMKLARYLSESTPSEGGALLIKTAGAMDFNADGQLAFVNVV